jgi:hypothetical protein
MTLPLLSILPNRSSFLARDLWLQNGKLNPSENFACHFDADDDKSPIIQVTAMEFLTQAKRAAAHLIEAGCKYREPGDPPKTLAIYATSEYTYYVYMVAATLIGWTVRHHLCLADYSNYVTHRIAL